MRIQQDTTLSMNLQVEIAIPNEARRDDADAQARSWSGPPEATAIRRA